MSNTPSFVTVSFKRHDYFSSLYGSKMFWLSLSTGATVCFWISIRTKQDSRYLSVSWAKSLNEVSACDWWVG